MKRLFMQAVLLLSVALSQSVLAASEAEQMATNLCSGCHGPVGISTNPLWPNLAGQNDQYAAKQLRAFRDGTRTDPAMNGLSQTLTDTQIDALAAYYARLPMADLTQ